MKKSIMDPLQIYLLSSGNVVKHDYINACISCREPNLFYRRQNYGNAQGKDIV